MGHLGVLLLLMFIGVNGQVSTYPHGLCSPHTSIFNTAACLKAIKSVATNESLFWYGTGYEQRCPRSKQDTPDCFNPHVKRPRTLAQGALGVDNPDLSKLDRILQVEFTSAPGEYTGCDASFKSDATVQFSINPLSNRTYEPWFMRSFPKLTWSVDGSRDLYTWIMFDAGWRFLHAIYMNIPGNDLSRAHAVKEFTGPENARYVPNSYTFMIFKQRGYIVPPRQPEVINFGVADFARRYNLIGPVALTWLLSSTDAYAVGAIKDSGFQDNCPALIERVYKEQHEKRPFLPDPLTDLTVDISMTYNSPEFTYECDNSNYTMAATSFTVDPIGMKLYKPALTRTETTRQITLTKRGLSPVPSDLNGMCFILLMVDADLPPPIFTKVIGNKFTPVAHYFLTNLRQTDGVLTANIALPYLGPLPPDEKPHTYYFMLFKDPNCLPEVDPALYTPNNCVPEVKNRCFFQVNKLVKDLDLTLAGLSWMRVERDTFSECYYENKAGIARSTLAWTFALPLVLYSFLN